MWWMEYAKYGCGQTLEGGGMFVRSYRWNIVHPCAFQQQPVLCNGIFANRLSSVAFKCI